MRNWLKEAPAGAFFVLAGIIGTSSALARDCSPPANAETVHVRFVHDGDTLVLDNDRKIRIIGINTPELERDGKAPEALAIRARNRLRQLVFASDNQVLLQYGADRKDRYGRHLANLWDTRKQSLAEQLLREGLGWSIAIPPNIRYLDCYTVAENVAHKAGRGVWGHPAWKIHRAKTLTLRDTGFRQVRGQVTRVNRRGGATWITLDNRLTLKLADEDQPWFPHGPGPEWVGRSLEVRGWLYRVRGKLRVNVHHPAMLTLSSQPTKSDQ
ncbi:endonuclease YncB(thermonuclease family) [Thiogranum longum]|uniref:Endonuclease YncB(Thermonuclease family) n=1 Tax=Thiogranum longum TaxID=1537524 RepID=A0A4R1H5M4_9GAMM|nr:thermonuclease family protein [Thiogranum longum]TCK17024.1 endonuclease YncB(thermonuclease family) [Thiogranum longum]